MLVEIIYCEKSSGLTKFVKKFGANCKILDLTSSPSSKCESMDFVNEFTDRLSLPANSIGTEQERHALSCERLMAFLGDIEFSPNAVHLVVLAQETSLGIAVARFISSVSDIPFRAVIDGSAGIIAHAPSHPWVDKIEQQYFLSMPRHAMA